MKIELVSVLKNEGASIGFSGEIPLGRFEFDGNDLNFEKPLKVSGNVLNIGGTIEVRADVEGEFITCCARCGTEVDKKIACELFESFAGDILDVDGENVSFKGSLMDISGAVRSAVLENLPLRFLCGENCKGLCPVCGANLNETDCNCSPESGGGGRRISIKL